MHAVLFAVALLANGGVHARQDAATQRPPFVAVVLPRSASLVPPPPSPPPPKGGGDRIAFSKYDPDLYTCGRGSASHFASEYRAFEARYQPRGVNEAVAYVPARARDLTLPEAPSPQRVGGYVMLRVAVGEDGTVRDALAACSTDDDLNEAALAAVRSATFVPATSNGKPVASLEKVEYWYAR